MSKRLRQIYDDELGSTSVVHSYKCLAILREFTKVSSLKHIAVVEDLINYMYLSIYLEY